MPRKQYFVLDNGISFVMKEEEPPPMTESEQKRFEKALKASERNTAELKKEPNKLF